MFKQAVAGLLYFHSKNIVHNDLKLTNILLMRADSCCLVKLTDFGMSHGVSLAVKERRLLDLSGTEGRAEACFTML